MRTKIAAFVSPRLWLAILSLSLAARAPTYWTPGGSDLRLFAYFGARWRAGAVPYRDIWDNKPPGIFALLAMVMPQPSSSTLGLAVAEALALATAALFIDALLRLLGTERVWRAAALGFFLLLNALELYADGGGYTEVFFLGPGVASVYFWVRGHLQRKPLWFVLAGACVGLGTLFKLPGLAPALAFLALSALQAITRRQRLRTCVRDCVLLGLGLAVPWGLAASYFARHGAAAELLRVSLLYPFMYGYSNLSARGGPLMILRDLGKVVWPMSSLMAMGLLGLAASLVAARRSDAAATSRTALALEAPPDLLVLVGLWAGADLAGALAGGRFYGHYFTGCTASGVVAFALACQHLLKNTTTPARLTVIIGLATPLVVFSSNDLIRSFIDRSQPRDFTVPQLRIAEYLRKNSHPSDSLFVWAYAPLIYQATGLRNAFPVTTSVNLQDSPRIGDMLFNNLVRRWKDAPPTLVVSVDPRESGTLALAGFERGFLDLVAASYDPVYTDGRYTVHRLRQDPPSVPLPPRPDAGSSVLSGRSRAHPP